MGISLDKAELLAIFLETLLYGIFFTLYWITLLLLIQRGHAGRSLRQKLIPVATLLLTLATAHLVVDFVRILEAFLIAKDANRYYADIAHPLNVVKTVIYATQTTIGDGVIVWRCYMIYNKSIYILLSASMLLAANACAGYVAAWSFSKALPGSNIFETASPWITTFFVLTVVINVFCPAAIVWRIYWTRRAAVSAQGSIFPVVLAIVESGTIYATGVLGSLVAYLTGTNGQYPALDVITPLVGITFSLILIQIRFHLHSNSHQIHIVPWTQSTDRMPRWNKQHSSNGLHGPQGSSGSLPLRTLSIHVTEQKEEGFPGERGQERPNQMISIGDAEFSDPGDSAQP